MAPTTWEKTYGYSKKGFDKAWNTLDKLGGPVNRLSNRVGSEAFWPMTMDKESDKAARILRSFCKDGFYAQMDEEEKNKRDSSGKIDRPVGKQRVLKKIPAEVIKRAKGLAIFTTMRTGLWVSGAGGSGVLLARIPETGEWSPPSGILLHTAGLGFLVGVDIYDCVVVINTYEALEGFKKIRCTLGGELSATAGPVGLGGVLESEVHKRQAPVWTYMKSRGMYAGVQVDGTIIIERTDENERFYGERISVGKILAGKVRHPPSELKTLMQTIKAAQGDTDVDEAFLLPPGEAPGDVDLVDSAFGIPAVDDPDPYGVKALEAEGLFIREAGTKARPSQDIFEFRPSPSSPIYSAFPRRSMDSSQRNSWRGSLQSYASVDRGIQTEDRPMTATTSVSRASSLNIKDITGSPEPNAWETSTMRIETNGDYDRHSEPEISEVSSTTVAKHESVMSAPPTVDAQKRLSPTFTRAKLVTIPKRIPPALPPRNPERKHDSISTTSSLPSPTSSLRHEFRRSDESPGIEAAGNVVPEETPDEFSELPADVEARIDALVDSITSDSSQDHTRHLFAEKDEFHSMPSSPDSEKEDLTSEEREEDRSLGEDEKREKKEDEMEKEDRAESPSRTDAKSADENKWKSDVEDGTKSEAEHEPKSDMEHDTEDKDHEAKSDKNETKSEAEHDNEGEDHEAKSEKSETKSEVVNEVEDATKREVVGLVENETQISSVSKEA